MSTYADYVALKKRQVIATTFTQNPPPPIRRNNTIITSVMANKASVYEKVPYSLTPAPGTPFGPAYVTPGVLPRQNNCCIQPLYTPAVPGVYTYQPNLSGTTGNTVGTLVSGLSLAGNVPSIFFDSLKNLYFYNGGSSLYKMSVGSSTLTLLPSVSTFPASGSSFAIDSMDNIYYVQSANVNGPLIKVNSVTGAPTQISWNLFSLIGVNYGVTGPVIDKQDRIFVITNDNVYLISPAGVASVFVSFPSLSFTYSCFYNKANDSIYVGLNNAAIRAITLGASPTVVNSYGTWPNKDSGSFVLDPTGASVVYYSNTYQIRVFEFAVGTSRIIAGIGSTGNADGPAQNASFASNLVVVFCTYGPDGTLYFIDRTNDSIRTIKGPTVTISPAIPAVFPNAGTLI